MYEHTIHILNSVVDHYKKMSSEEIEGYNKRGDKMGALGCAMAYEQVFADISDALETLKSISDEMEKDLREGEEIDRRDGASGDDIYKEGEAEDG